MMNGHERQRGGHGSYRTIAPAMEGGMGGPRPLLCGADLVGTVGGPGRASAQNQGHKRQRPIRTWGRLAYGDRLLFADSAPALSGPPQYWSELKTILPLSLTITDPLYSLSLFSFSFFLVSVRSFQNMGRPLIKFSVFFLCIWYIIQFWLILI